MLAAVPFSYYLRHDHRRHDSGGGHGNTGCGGSAAAKGSPAASREQLRNITPKITRAGDTGKGSQD